MLTPMARKALTRDWASLGAAVEARRVQLGMTQADVAAADGPSEGTIRKLENRAVPISAASMEKLRRALHWPPGHPEAILAGADPDAPLPPNPETNPDVIHLGFVRGTLAGRTPREIERLNQRAREAVLAELDAMDAEAAGVNGLKTSRSTRS